MQHHVRAQHADNQLFVSCMKHTLGRIGAEKAVVLSADIILEPHVRLRQETEDLLLELARFTSSKAITDCLRRANATAADGLRHLLWSRRMLQHQAWVRVFGMAPPDYVLNL